MYRGAVPGSVEELLDIARVRELARNGTARTIREAAGLSQGEVARAVGVSVPALHRWEKGDRTPRGDPAIRYAHVLDSLIRRGR